MLADVYRGIRDGRPGRGEDAARTRCREEATDWPRGFGRHIFAHQGVRGDVTDEAFHVLFNDTFRFVREIVGEREAALEFMVEIEGISGNGIDLIRWGEDGRIVDFKVMLRPLKAINLVHQKMAAMLEAMKEK
jgi:hypothetical protein